MPAGLLLNERWLSSMVPELRAGTEGDAASIRALLESAGLPTEDLLTSNPQFVVAWDNSRLVAVGALQRFAAAALLRSVAVAPDRRGSGLGRTIVRDLERIANLGRVERLFLLTQTSAVAGGSGCDVRPPAGCTRT